MSEEDKARENARRRMLNANKSEEEKERSRAAEKERKMKERSNLCVKPKGYKGISYEEELERNKVRMRKFRANKSEEEKNEELRKNRERKIESRANKCEEEKFEEMERNKERIRKFRANKSEEERKERAREQKDALVTEFERISLKHQKRDWRKKRNGKEKLMENLKSKKGMRLFREEGRLKQFKERESSNATDQTMDWKKFMNKGKHHAEMAAKLKPDLIKKINEMFREEKEQLRRQKQKEQEEERRRKAKVLEDGGEWVFNPEYSEYFWVGEVEPVVDHWPEYKHLSEKELKDIQEQEEIWLQASIDERKIEAKEKRRKKYEEMKEAMKTPLGSLPEKELCEYEKMRERNIKEREQAMEESGFFEDLQKFKKKIGLR